MAIKNIVKAQPLACTARGQPQGWERGRGGSPGGARGGHKDTGRGGGVVMFTSPFQFMLSRTRSLMIQKQRSFVPIDAQNVVGVLIHLFVLCNANENFQSRMYI